MDTDMADITYDIEIDAGSGMQPSEPTVQQAVEQTPASKEGIPAAYLEDLSSDSQKPWPECLNLQGVGDFDPNDPLYYAMEHCGTDPRVKQLRWVNDTSVNLEFYNAQDAAVALGILTHVEVTNANSMGPQESRRAKPYSKKPDSVLMIRETNQGDQKQRGAANRSTYYRSNPDVAGNRQREPRRRPPPKRDFLDYGDEDTGSRERPRRRSFDDAMDDDSGIDRRRNRQNGRDYRDDRGRGRGNREADSGRLKGDVDSYRPGSRSARESQFGRLRGRSASPRSDEEGDGRYGFAEDDTHAGRRRYRSRSRSQNTRRRRDASGERWTHDRANHDRTSSGRWQKDAFFIDSSPMGNHRRSDAMDATSSSRGGNSLLSRMTKDGQPVVATQKRSLADRITRDDDGDNSYGRLKNDDRDPFVSDFSEPTEPRGLADRMTRDGDINIRGRGQQEGINIRGTASGNGAAGINIRGMAGA